jgi:hypothetical protein
MPACIIKFTPFALRQRSSAIGRPSKTDGVCASSFSVKSHWLESSDAMVIVYSCLGRAWGCRGGEYRADCRGGEGTAGGI